MTMPCGSIVQILLKFFISGGSTSFGVRLKNPGNVTVRQQTQPGATPRARNNRSASAKDLLFSVSYGNTLANLLSLCRETVSGCARSFIKLKINIA
jgi:hypothetical protein